MAANTFPADWAEMTSTQVGSATRNTAEPGGSRLKLLLDVDMSDIMPTNDDGTITFDFIDFTLPSLAVGSYSTQLLAQRKYATQAVSRIISADQISGTIECPGAIYAQLMGLLGATGTVRIEIPNQLWYEQWRVAILSVDGPSVVDGDRMTGSLTLTVTNTAADGKSECGPVFGTLDPEDDVPVDGPTLTPGEPTIGT
jgi:hypothetical protein